MSEPRLWHEKRAWGEYTVLHHLQREDGGEALTKHLVILPGKNISYQYHLHRREIWTIIAGSGTLALEGEYQTVKIGDILEIPCGAKHSLLADSELHLIEVQLGTPLSEEDIVRITADWSLIS